VAERFMKATASGRSDGSRKACETVDGVNTVSTNIVAYVKG